MSLQSAVPLPPALPLQTTASALLAPSQPLLEYANADQPAREPGADILACGFGMTVAAWIAAYLTRMPLLATPAPGQVTILLMLTMVFIGGFLAARYSAKGLMAALLAGAVSGMLDILVVGSLLHDMAKDASAPAAIQWIGGSILLNTVVAGIGGLIGSFFPSKRRSQIRWTAVFALVLAAATLPLITAGGLVTAFGAGLAVPDWPQSYGYNMFLFPLSKMQSASGNFYEHAHRLMGSLVGFTSIVLAIQITVAQWRGRRTLIPVAWAIVVAVGIQGLMGGLRVTEKSILLAAVHGIFAQIVFASMACLAAAALPNFYRFTVTNAPGLPKRPKDAIFPMALVAALLLQLTLGALVRQKVDAMIIPHVTMAAFVAVIAVAAGFRAVSLHGTFSPIRRAGIAVLTLVTLQLLLGIIALVVRPVTGESPTTTSALFTTAHQANGALLLATSAALALWTLRFKAPSINFQSHSVPTGPR